jgi:hypothetical protein
MIRHYRRDVKRHSAAIRVAANLPNIPLLSVGDMVQKMSYVALMDAIKEGFYWVYAPITVGWCNCADGKDVLTRSTWKDGVVCAGCIRMTRPIVILKTKRVKTMERFGCVVSKDA